MKKKISQGQHHNSAWEAFEIDQEAQPLGDLAVLPLLKGAADHAMHLRGLA
jgi:hypothetical protein